MSPVHALLAATAFALVLSVQGDPFSAPLQTDATTTSESFLATDTGAPSQIGTDSCWLYRWRALTWDDIEHQAIDWKGALERSWGPTVISVILGCFSIVLMVVGWWLGKALLFLVGLVCGTGATFFVINAIFNWAMWTNCYVLGFGSLVGGILAGFLFWSILQLGLFCFGAAIGGVCGYWLYGIAFKSISTKVILGYDMIFWACVLILAILFGFLTLRNEDLFFIIGTAICGSFLFAIAFDQLAFGGGHLNLSKIQTECVLGQHSDAHPCPDGMDDWSKKFYIVAFGSIALALVSMFVQHRLLARHRQPEGNRERRTTNYIAV